MTLLLERIKKLPLGFCEVCYENEKYSVTRTDFNNGKSIKIFAKSLSGINFISLNYYITSNNELLKPCEMPQEKVIHFLNNYILIE